MINVNPIYKFLSWLSFFLFICLIGISNVFGDVYPTDYSYYQQYYDNYGSSVTSVSTTWNTSLQSYVSASIGTTANSYGAGLSISSPIPLLANHTYTLSIFFIDRSNIALSSKNQISVADSLSAAANDYANNNPGTTLLYSSVSNNSVLKFAFKVNNNHTFLFIPFTTTYNTSQTYVLNQIVIDDLGSEGVSQTDINNSLNQQTIQIENIINNMQQAVSDSIDELSDTLTENQKVCYDTGVNDISIDNKALNTSGDEFSNNSFGISKYFTINGDTNIEVLNTTTSTTGYCFYSANKGKLGCYNESNLTQGQVLIIPENAKYFRFSINKDSKRPQFRICKNGNQATNDTLNELNDTLNDTSSADLSSLSDSAGWLPAGPIDSIINLPLNFLNSILSALSGTCSPLNITIPFLNTNASIPCLSTIFGQITGLTTFWNWVGRIASIYILYRYLISLWEYYDRLTTMQVNFRDDFGGGV